MEQARLLTLTEQPDRGNDGMATLLPDGYQTVTPRIVARDAEGLVAFLRDVFGATGEFRADLPSDVRFGEALVMVSEAGPREAMSACLYLYVDDADATYGRAMKAGATSLEEPLDTPYGDRRAMVRDGWGNTWQIATYRPVA